MVLLYNAFLIQLVSSVLLPSIGLEQVGKIVPQLENTFAHVHPPATAETSNSLALDILGSIEKGPKTISPFRHPTPQSHIDKPSSLAGSKRRIHEILNQEEILLDLDGSRSQALLGEVSKEFNAGQNAELRRKLLRKKPKVKTEPEPLEKPNLERQESFKTNFNEDFDNQGQVGACHIFATLEVIHDATNGLKLSKEKLFLDHLLSLTGLSHDSIDKVLEHNVKEIKRVRKLSGAKRCADSISWEGGDFPKNFDLLKTYGGVVVANNGNWKEIDTIMRSIQKAQDKAIQSRHFNPADTKESLRTLVTSIFQRGAHLPEEQADRRLVSGLLADMGPEYFSYEDTKRSLLKDTYHLIKIIENKGTAYIGVDSKRFYQVIEGGRSLTWKLKQGKSADHAVALVGFSVSKNKFYIKDSNTPTLIEMSPKDLFLSMEDGFVLVPKQIKAKL